MMVERRERKKQSATTMDAEGLNEEEDRLRADGACREASTC